MDTYFWDSVKTRLRRIGLTQETLADYLEVPPELVRKWIHRNSLPDVTRGAKIAHFLGISVEELAVPPATLVSQMHSAGEVMRIAMAKKGLTAIDVAERSPVDLDVLNRYLVNNDPPQDVNNYALIARVLEVPMEYLALQVTEIRK